MACCVPRCRNKTAGSTVIYYHRFPCDPYLSSKWVRSINVSMPNGGSWRPQPDDVVCSNHFLATDFRPNMPKTLKPNAIPSVFTNLVRQSSEPDDDIPAKRMLLEGPALPTIVKMVTPEESDDDMDVQLISLLKSPQNKEPVTVNSTNVPSKVVEETGHTPNTALKTTKVDSGMNTESLALSNSSSFDKSSLQKTPAQPLSTAGKSHVQKTPNQPTSTAGKSCVLQKTPVQPSSTAGKSRVQKTPVQTPGSNQRNPNSSMNLIEISPRTFLKINPEVIRVAEKVTPSGNTVLQFLMNSNSTGVDQKNVFKVASNIGLPPGILKPGTTIIQKTVSSPGTAVVKSALCEEAVAGSSKPATPLRRRGRKVLDIDSFDRPTVTLSPQHKDKPNVTLSPQSKKRPTVTLSPQHKDRPNVTLSPQSKKRPTVTLSPQRKGRPSCKVSAPSMNLATSASKVKINQKPTYGPSDADSDKNMIPDTPSLCSPALLTPNFPLRYPNVISPEKQACYKVTIRQKNKQIHTLRTKISNLTKKMEELETRCVVQERQLDFSSLKKLKEIKKASENGDHHATFVSEQIRAFPRGSKVKWSTSTMNQCSVWYRKAPYAYEYFKKAGLFRLPAHDTVKRYLRNNPDVTVQIKNRTLNVSGLDSDSSDFEFDDDDNEEGFPEVTEDDNNNQKITQNKQIVTPSKPRIAPSKPRIAPSKPRIAPSKPRIAPSKPRMAFGDERIVQKRASGTVNNNVVLESSCYEQNHTDTNQDGHSAEADVSAEVSVQTTDTVVVTTDAIPNSETIQCGQSSASSGVTFVIPDHGNLSETITSNIASSTEDEPGKTVGETVTTINLNGQEIVLQPGNVIQLSGDFGSEFENQYFVVENTDGEHQYTAGQPVSYVIQSSEDQVVYVTENSNESQNVSVPNVET